MILINALSNFMGFSTPLNHPKTSDNPLANRLIKRLYKNIEWPSHMKQICIMTKVEKEQDITSAAKVITLMQRICPTLTFDWVLQGCMNQEKCLSLLQDKSKVHIRFNDLEKNISADFILIGPEKIKNIPSYQREEIPFFVYKDHIESNSDIIKELTSFVYPQASNIFVLPKSLGYGNLSFLNQIKDSKLLDNLQPKDITKAHSFNFGYIDDPSDLRKFIDYVSTHEVHKHVIIITNQIGDIEQGQLTPVFFNSEQLNLFKQKGYGKILFKDQDQEPIILQQAENPLIERDLTIITHHLFTLNDLKWLQLASERLFINDPTFINDLKWLQSASLELLLDNDCINEKITEGAIKQTAWHYLIPELCCIEDKSLNSIKEKSLQNLYKQIKKKIIEYKISKMSFYQKKILLIKELDWQLSH